MKSAIFVSALFALYFQSCAAEELAERTDFPPVVMENTEIRTLHSDTIGETYKLLIAKPFGRPPQPNEKYPVIYVLDAEIAFPMVRQIAMSLQFGLEAPPALIVGIAYSGDPRRTLALRARDFTPTFDDTYAQYAVKWEGGTGREDSLGKAEDFLVFMRDEVAPFVEENYDADPNNATLFGSSFGGLFAAYALLTEPNNFRRYILSSPSLWWDSRYIFDLESQYADTHNDLDATVFIAAGGHERKEYGEKMIERAPPRMRQATEDFKALLGDGAQMVEVVEPFVAQLNARNYESLNLTLHIFPEETHSSTPPMAVSRGLRVVFEKQ